MLLAARPPQDGTPLLCPGLCDAQNPNRAEENSTVLHRRSAGACRPRWPWCLLRIFTPPPPHLYTKPSLPPALLNHPKYRLPIMNFNPYPQKKAFTWGEFRRDMTNIILVGSGKYTPGGTLTTRSSKCPQIPDKGTPAPGSSSYHGWVTPGSVVQRSRIRGRIPSTYGIMAIGYPWVTP